MVDTLPRLLALQACDQRIRQAVHTVATLRRSLTAVHEEAESKTRDIQARRDTIAEAEQRRDALAEQLDQIKAQLRDKKQTLRRRLVRYLDDALERDVRLLEARKAALEEELDTVLTQISQDTTVLHQAEASVPTHDEERQCAASTLLGQIAALEEEQRVAQGERRVLAASIAPLLLHQYERIFSHRGGVAVVAIVHETCQGCHLHVPAHLCLELQRHLRLTFCPNCQRILFVTNEATASSPPAQLPPSNGRQPRRSRRRASVATRTGKARLAVTPSQPPSAPA